MRVTRGSDNVFADIGCPEAPLLLAKADLAIAISKRIAELGLTQTAAAQLMGLDQPKVSALVHRRLNGFSLERLMECLGALQYQVTINLRPVTLPATGGVRVVRHGGLRQRKHITRRRLTRA